MASSSAGRPGPPKGLVGPSSAFQPYNGAKRLVIKNLRPPTEAADRNAQIQKHYERTHSELGEALVAILTGGKPAVPLERLYRGVEDLCRRGEGSRVHRTLRGSLEHHVTNVLQPRIQKAGSGSNIEMAKQLLAEWQAWNAQMVPCQPPNS